MAFIRRPWFLILLAAVLICTAVLSFALFAMTGAKAMSRWHEAPLVPALPDPEAERVLRDWSKAMVQGPPSVAMELFDDPDPRRRQETVQRLMIETSNVISRTKALGLMGPYLRRMEIVGMAVGPTQRHRIGLSRLYFTRGSLCFTTRLVRTDTSWRVRDWQLADDACARLVEQSLPGEPPDVTERDKARKAYHTWVMAVLIGNADLAEPLFAEPDPEKRRKVVGDLVQMTNFVVRGNEERYGPFLGYQTLELYPESPRHQIGYTRVNYEQGHICLRTDLRYGDGAWRVHLWDQVTPEACEE